MRSFHRWTTKELKFLEDNYDTLGAKTCAASLGVSIKVVYQRMFSIRHPEAVRFQRRLYLEKLESRV